MPKVRKTKEMYQAEIEELNEKIAELEAAAERADRYRAYDEMAAEIRAMQDSFEAVGYSTAEALTLTMEMTKMVAKVALPKLF